MFKTNLLKNITEITFELEVWVLDEIFEIENPGRTLSNLRSFFINEGKFSLSSPIIEISGVFITLLLECYARDVVLRFARVDRVKKSVVVVLKYYIAGGSDSKPVHDPEQA